MREKRGEGAEQGEGSNNYEVSFGNAVDLDKLRYAGSFGLSSRQSSPTLPLSTWPWCAKALDSCRPDLKSSRNWALSTLRAFAMRLASFSRYLGG